MHMPGSRSECSMTGSSSHGRDIAAVYLRGRSISSDARGVREVRVENVSTVNTRRRRDQTDGREINKS